MTLFDVATLQPRASLWDRACRVVSLSFDVSDRYLAVAVADGPSFTWAIGSGADGGDGSGVLDGR